MELIGNSSIDFVSRNDTMETKDAIPPHHTVFLGRLLLGASLVAMFALSIAVNWGIVYYEQAVSGLYRTLVNKMAATMAIYNIIMAVASYPTMFLREIVFDEGLPELVCFVNQYITQFGLAQSMMTHLEVSVLQYLYVCVLSSVGSIQEELVWRFLVVLNATLGSLGSIMLTIRNSKTLVHNYCNGISSFGKTWPKTI